MKKEEQSLVAYKVCESCGGYDSKFCKNCGAEVDEYNRCPDCNKFVKTESCPECGGMGHEEEYRVGDKCQYFVSYLSNKEDKKFVKFKGNTSKFYVAKIMAIISNDEVRIRVKGKETIVSTNDLC